MRSGGAVAFHAPDHTVFFSRGCLSNFDLADYLCVSNYDLSVCLRFESGMIEPPSGREVARLAVTEGARGTNTENSHIKAHKVKSRRLLHPSSTGAPSRREPLLAYFFHPLCRHNTLINPNLTSIIFINYTIHSVDFQYSGENLAKTLKGGPEYVTIRFGKHRKGSHYVN